MKHTHTILTITITLVCGLLWGMLCGAMTNIISHTIFEYGWGGYLFALCSIATALITWLFMRLFPNVLDLRPETLNAKKQAETAVSKSVKTIYKESKFRIVIDKVIALVILSFSLCIVISFLGGIIASFIIIFTENYNTGITGISAVYSKTMFGGTTPVLVAEIISRIPVNYVDRIVEVFLAYGIALGFRRIAVSRD